MIDYILKCISEIQAISQNGLTYCKNQFDIERYNQLGFLPHIQPKLAMSQNQVVLYVNPEFKLLMS
jgi:hypothetical protein